MKFKKLKTLLEIKIYQPLGSSYDTRDEAEKANKFIKGTIIPANKISPNAVIFFSEGNLNDIVNKVDKSSQKEIKVIYKKFGIYIYDSSDYVIKI